METTPHWRLAPIRYRLVHLMYVMALVATSFMAFGPAGIIIGILLVALWVIVFLVEPIAYGLTFAFFTAATLLLFGCLCLTPNGNPRGAAYRMRCANNLKQIGLGLHNYHDQYGQFPPTHVIDQNDRPMHSWRTLIMPFTEQYTTFQQYEFTEPWDSPRNSLLQSKTPPYQQCPTDEKSLVGETSYVAICGHGATWTNQNAKQMSDFSPRANDFIVIIETNDSGIVWTEPRDFTLEEAVQQLSNPDNGGRDGHRPKGLPFQIKDISGHNVLLADGSVVFVPIMKEEAARRFLTGNTEVLEFRTHDDVDRSDNDFVLRFSIFIVVALLPWYGVISRLTGSAQKRKNESADK